jgi:hypothetical protein
VEVDVHLFFFFVLKEVGIGIASRAIVTATIDRRSRARGERFWLRVVDRQSSPSRLSPCLQFLPGSNI